MMLKFATTISAFFFVWFIKNKPFSRDDHNRLKVSFILLLLNDIFLVLLPFFFNEPVLFITGLFCVIISHIFLIIRNGYYWRFLLPEKGHYSIKIPFLVTGLAVYLITSLLFLKFWKPMTEIGIFIPFSIYCFFLAASVWIGISCLFLKNYIPLINRIFISAAMILFYFCDLFIGLELITPVPFQYLFKSFIWIVYSPTLVFLSLSSIDFSKTGMGPHQ